MKCPHGVPIDEGPPCGACVRGELPGKGMIALVAKLMTCQHPDPRSIRRWQDGWCGVCGAYLRAGVTDRVWETPAAVAALRKMVRDAG